MVKVTTSIVLRVVLVFIAVCFSDGVSPDVGAPDSNNLSLDFTPDDSVAGGTDTSLDNNNATPLFITRPPPTTAPPTTSTTSATTVQPLTTILRIITSIETTGSVVTTVVPTTTSTTTTTTPSTTTTSTSTRTQTVGKPVPTATSVSGWEEINTGLISRQNQYNWPRENPNIQYNNQGIRTYPNIQPYEQQTSYYPQSEPQPLPRPAGRFNIPWWMLLIDEV